MRKHLSVLAGLTVALVPFGGTISGRVLGLPIRVATSKDGVAFRDANVVAFADGDRPDLEVGPDGKLVALAQVRGQGEAGGWAVATSADGGRTWTRPRLIRVKNSTGELREIDDAELVSVRGTGTRLYVLVSGSRTADGSRRPQGSAGNVGVFRASSRDGSTFRAAAKAVFECSGSARGRLAAGWFEDRLHFYVDGGDQREEGGGARSLEHRVSRDGRRFVPVQPSKVPDDVTIGSVVGLSEGARLYASDGESVFSFLSRDGRSWRRERGVRLANATSPAVGRQEDGSYVMLFVDGGASRSGEVDERLSQGPAAEEVKSIQPVEGQSEPRAAMEAGGVDPEGDVAAVTVEAGERGGEEDLTDGEGEIPEETELSDAPIGEELALGATGAQSEPLRGARSAEVEKGAKPIESTGDKALIVTARGRIDGEASDGIPGADFELEEPDDVELEAAEESEFVPRPDREPEFDYLAWFTSQLPSEVEDDASTEYAEISADPRLKTSEEGEAPVFLNMFSDPEKPDLPAPWDPAEHPEWEESSKKVSDLVEKFRRAAEKAGYAPPARFEGAESRERTPLLLELVLPDLASHRTLAKATIAEGWKKESGEVLVERLLGSFRSVLRGANHFSDRLTLIENLVSLAERRLVFENALWALHHGVISSPEDLRKAISILKGHGRDSYDPTRAARAEYAMAAQLVQYLYSGIGEGGRPRLNVQRAEELSENFNGMTGTDDPEFIDRLASMDEEEIRATLDAVDRFWRETAEQLRIGYPDVRREDIEATQEKYVHTSALTEGLLPGLSRVLVLRTRNEAMYRATVLVYVVHLFHAERGRWPSNLTELPRGEIAEFRVDPFTGRDFAYRVEGGEPLVYSLSENGRDDGGVHHPRWGDGSGEDREASDDFVFWPIQSGR